MLDSYIVPLGALSFPGILVAIAHILYFPAKTLPANTGGTG